MPSVEYCQIKDPFNWSSMGKSEFKDDSDRDNFWDMCSIF